MVLASRGTRALRMIGGNNHARPAVAQARCSSKEMGYTVSLGFDKMAKYTEEEQELIKSTENDMVFVTYKCVSCNGSGKHDGYLGDVNGLCVTCEGSGRLRMMKMPSKGRSSG